MSPDRPIETERLTLRRSEPGGVEDLSATQSDREVARYLHDEPRDLLARKGEWQSEVVDAVLEHEWR